MYYELSLVWLLELLHPPTPFPSLSRSPSLCNESDMATGSDPPTPPPSPSLTLRLSITLTLTLTLNLKP